MPIFWSLGETFVWRCTGVCAKAFPCCKPHTYNRLLKISWRNGETNNPTNFVFGGGKFFRANFGSYNSESNFCTTESTIGVGDLHSDIKVISRDGSISVHLGYKIQAALCVNRLPLVYQEPEFVKHWRTFKEAWEQETNNGLRLADEITFMKYPFQFLDTEEAIKKKEEQLQKSGSSTITELEYLLSQEGLSDIDFLPKKSDLGTVNEDDNSIFMDQHQKSDSCSSSTESYTGLHSLDREPSNILYLIVKYGNSWQFPVADRMHGESMRNTLRSLCHEQLGPQFSPYFLGHCPLSYEKRKFSNSNRGIDGKKVFYYRAHFLMGSSNVSIPKDGLITDFAWVTRKEAQSYLSERKFAAIRDCLYLE